MKRNLTLIERTAKNAAIEVIRIIEELSKKQQEAFMASGFVKAMYASSQTLGSLWKSLDATINTVADMLQEPVDEKNINKVDKYLRGLDARVDNFDNALSDLKYKISELRDEFVKYVRKESGIE